ncbi:MAG: ABC transporter ATP-binding protein [Eubacteriales bacterium]
MKKKEPAKKPYRSLGSNALWSFCRMLNYAPVSFIMMTLRVPVNIAMTYAGVYLPSLVVAEVTGNHTLAEAMTTVGLLMLAMLAGNLLNTVFGRVSGAHLGVYRYRVTSELHRKSLGCFYQTYESKKIRDLLDRAERATQMWDGVMPLYDMPRQTLGFIESVVNYILFGSVISFVSPWLVPILTVAPAVNWFCVRAYQKWEYANRRKWSDIDRKLWYIHLKSSDFAAAKDIRIYSMADWFKEMYRLLSAERAEWDRKLIVRSFLSRIADLVVILLRDGAAYALLIAMTLRGEITVDKFVLYFAAISSFASFIGGILGGWNAMHSTSLTLCDLREYLELPEWDGTGEAKIEDYINSPPEITFDRVSFRYDGAETDTLHDVSFTIHSGESIALVGLNGAGKTTLVKLLCGLYMPTSGEIRVNGTPTGKFLRRDYYQLFSPVFQNVKTAFFSLAETVSAKGEAETDFTRAEECMRLAGLGEKIDSLPNGIRTRLDKQVNRDGVELSGGETQKLMLARALYKDAPVLVLDEPTAALDPIAESSIYQEYQRMSAGKSSLFISHRLASTRFCDRILYLKNGTIAEEGSHDELIRNGGEYAELFELQSCWYRGEGKGEESNEIQ